MKRSTRSISRPTVTCMTRSMRCCRLARRSRCRAGPWRRCAAIRASPRKRPPTSDRAGAGRCGRRDRRASRPTRSSPRSSSPHGAGGAAGQLVEDHRPRPERGQQQDQHDDFDDGVRLQKQRDDRQIVRNRTGERQGVDGSRRHSLNLLWRLLDDRRHRRRHGGGWASASHRRHGTSSASPASGRRARRSSWAGSAAGTGRPRWRKASRVSMRPRGVRCTKPCWIR